MSGELDMGEIERRARTAGYDDGLLEIFAAVVLLVIALGWAASPGLVGILAAFIVLFGWKVVDRVKARVTYPRIGYYRERADEPRSSAKGMLLSMGGAFVVMIIAIAAVGDLSDAAEWRRAAPLLSGMLLAAGFWYAGEQSGLIRHRAVAGVSVVWGALLWWLGSGADYSGVIWHLIGLSVPLAAVGIWSLFRFTRTHPVSERATDG
jgi:amino acid transporter